jgi:sugar phosphate permease
MKSNQGTPFYGWTIVAVSFLVNLTVFGLSIHGFTALVKPIEEELEWSRKAISAAMACASLSMAIAAPFVGRLIDRIGARFVMPAGAGIMGVCCLLMSRMQSLSSFYILYGIAGVGQAAATMIPISLVISNWFHVKRGRALGIAMAGTGLGGMIFVPIVTWVITNWGWRTAFLFAGTVILLTIPTTLGLIRTRPSEKGLLPDGESVSKGDMVESEGLTVQEAVRTTSFWLIGAMMFLFGAVVMGVVVHLMSYLTDIGHSRRTASFVFAVMTALTVVGKIGIGFIADRWGLRQALALTYSLITAGILFLLGAKSLLVACASVVVYGFAAGAPLLINPALTAECIGLRQFGAVYGSLTLISTLGTGIGAFLAGAVYDTTQSYIPVFVLFAVCMVVAGLCGLGTRKEIRADPDVYLKPQAST